MVDDPRLGALWNAWDDFAFDTSLVEDSLVETIQRVKSAGAVSPPDAARMRAIRVELTALRVDSLPISSALPAIGPALNMRELEILTLVRDGLSNAEIGRRLAVSHMTVKNHLTSILRKLDVNDRNQAVLIAMRRGWLHSASMWSSTDDWPPKPRQR
jgi:DNA-binding NarL/FixJ family response regulator